MTPWRSVAAALMLALVVAAGPGAGAAESEWSIHPSPNAIADQHNFVNAVDCVSPSDCWAVGYFRTDTGYETLALHWDGSSWSVVPTPPATSVQTFLNGVGCASSSECWAVGSFWDGSVYRQLIERWDGTSWSIVPEPPEDPMQNRRLYGVTCAASADCWAVGIASTGPASSAAHPLIEHWDGTGWTLVPAPEILPSRGGILTSVDCVGPADCSAVGYAVRGSVNQPLAVRWDGTSWSVAPTPSTGLRDTSGISGMTCVSTSDCWAVGFRNDGPVNQTLIMRWNGSTWTIIPSPNGGQGVPNTLFGVACPSASDCWAVGYYKPGGPLQTLILRWDGGAWRMAPSPNTSTGQTNTLRAVSCAGPVCTAAGNYYNAQSTSRTLTLRHTGSDPAPLGQQPPLQIADIAGDANGLHDAGVEQDTRPASVDALDLVAASARTRYEAIPVGDDGIHYEPTGLEIVSRTTGVPGVPPGVPSVVFRLESMAGTCRLGLDVLLRESVDAPPTAEALWHELGEGCPNSGSFPAIRDLEGAIVTVDPDARTVAVEIPFSSLSAAEASMIGVGRTLAAPRGESRGPLVHAGSGNDLDVDRSELVDATPRGEAFTVASDVPPDVPCTSGCPE